MPAPDPAPAPDLDALATLFKAGQREAEQALLAQERAAREQESRDRSVVTGTVMVVFAATLALSLATFVVAGLFSGKWEALAPHIVDILKSIVLPVVTLVLGYYFGRGGRG